jgi:SAM-dependent methyltransferase
MPETTEQTGQAAPAANPGAMDETRVSLPPVEFRFPFPPDTFDTCLVTSVFTHVPMDEVEHYLEELYTVTRPGGRVFCTVFCAGET